MALMYSELVGPTVVARRNLVVSDGSDRVTEEDLKDRLSSGKHDR
jgi:hypothetical protein